MIASHVSLGNMFTLLTIDSCVSYQSGLDKKLAGLLWSDYLRFVRHGSASLSDTGSFLTGKSMRGASMMSSPSTSPSPGSRSAIHAVDNYRVLGTTACASGCSGNL